jgi:hypothetical protein
VRCKSPKKEEEKNHMIFLDFGVKKFIVKTPLKKKIKKRKKTLSFECYNLLNLMELKVVIF